MVAAGIADRCEIGLACAIGMPEAVAVMVDTKGTGRIPDEQIADIVCKVFDFTPAGIIRDLDLRRPIYRKTTNYGHFGREDAGFTWEETNKADEIRKAAGMEEYVPGTPD